MKDEQLRYYEALAKNLQTYTQKESKQVNKWQEKDSAQLEEERARKRQEERARIAKDEEIDRLKREQQAIGTVKQVERVRSASKENKPKNTQVVVMPPPVAPQPVTEPKKARAAPAEPPKKPSPPKSSSIKINDEVPLAEDDGFDEVPVSEPPKTEEFRPSGTPDRGQGQININEDMAVDESGAFDD